MTSTASSAWRGVPYLHSRPSMGLGGSFTRTRSRRRSGCFPHWLHGAARGAGRTVPRPTWLLRLHGGCIGAADVGAVHGVGDYERHVNRQRTRYRRLLSALIDVLAASSAGDHLHFANAGGRLHFLMEVRGVEGDERDSATFEERVARRAAIRGVRLAPLGRIGSRVARPGAPGRSSNETVGCRCEAREVEGAPKGMRRGAVWVQRGEGSAPSRLRDELPFLGRRDDPGGSRDRLGGGCGRAGRPCLADDVAVDGEGDHFEGDVLARLGAGLGGGALEAAAAGHLHAGDGDRGVSLAAMMAASLSV